MTPRQTAPRHRVCSWIVGLACAGGRDDLGQLYLVELVAHARDEERKKEWS